jgi:hypothetical protein
MKPAILCIAQKAQSEEARHFKLFGLSVSLSSSYTPKLPNALAFLAPSDNEDAFSLPFLFFLTFNSFCFVP